MALTSFQQKICRLLSKNRILIGESYVAGGSALNLFTRSNRISRDIDLFHDTLTALESSWDMDRSTLIEAGYELQIIHERSGYIEVILRQDTDAVLIQWTRDSAFRFFPLIEDELLGLTMHPFDLATNKALALVGRLEVRDWVDVIQCHSCVQNLGYLIWAACGKDPGFGPVSLLEQAARSGRYSHDELDHLIFDGESPDMGILSRKWHDMLQEARCLIQELPPEMAGRCVLNKKGELYVDGLNQLKQDLAENRVGYHTGCIRGAFPEIL
ncbi:hypothetical protein K8T06_07380 [bacterium]|nr:hypothetical protein [bacterium]